MGLTRFDFEDQVANKQVVTATAVSQHGWDKQSPTRDISIGGCRMAIGVFVDVGNTGGGTITFEAIEATNIALTTGVNVVGSTGAVAAADLFAGAVIEVPLIQGKMGKGQYLGLRMTVAGGTTPSTTISAYVMPQEEITKWKPFPKVNEAVVS